MEEHGLQCGFCTPGMMLTARALLDRNPDPSTDEIRTVEDLEQDGELDPVQSAFMNEHGLQCGFCTPGMMMTARWLLDHNPDPSEAEIREAICGQICRCTGYENIVRAVRAAAGHPSIPNMAVPNVVGAPA